jgi:hypothetical protein
MEKQFTFNSEQIHLLQNLVDTAIDAMEDYKIDNEKLTKSEKKELDNLYQLLYELSYSDMERVL